MPSRAPVRIVEVGDCHRRRGTHDLGIVELTCSRIAAGDEKPAHRVNQPRPRAALATAEVARVLMQQRRENGLCRQIFDREISIGGAEPFGVALHALSEGRIRVARLANSRKDPSLEEYSSICRIIPRNREFSARGQLLCSFRRVVGCPVICEEPKNALILLGRCRSGLLHRCGCRRRILLRTNVKSGGSQYRNPPQRQAMHSSSFLRTIGCSHYSLGLFCWPISFKDLRGWMTWLRLFLASNSLRFTI